MATRKKIPMGMKIYEGHVDEDHFFSGVTVNGQKLNPRHDLVNHSPSGLSWGYHGSGPSQTALAILADALQDDERALRLYQYFKDAVIAKLPQTEPWRLSYSHIELAVANLEDRIAEREREMG